MTCDARCDPDHAAMRWHWRHEADTRAFATDLVAQLRPDDLVAIDGPMGAGKTTFVRHCYGALGGDPDRVSSPSYDLVHRYDGARFALWHVDAWRLGGDEDWDALGLDDCAQGDVVMVEWAARIPRLAAATVWRLEIHPAGGDERAVTLRVPPGVAIDTERIAPALRKDQRGSE